MFSETGYWEVWEHEPVNSHLTVEMSPPPTLLTGRMLMRSVVGVSTVKDDNLELPDSRPDHAKFYDRKADLRAAP
jgi:hypothetical protein